MNLANQLSHLANRPQEDEKNDHKCYSTSKVKALLEMFNLIAQKRYGSVIIRLSEVLDMYNSDRPDRKLCYSAIVVRDLLRSSGFVLSQVGPINHKESIWKVTWDRNLPTYTEQEIAAEIY